MRDITKCSNGDKCSHKDDCYRWVSEPCGKIQSWSNFYEKNVECAMLWSIKKWANSYGK